MDKVLKLENGQYDLVETVTYPNGGASYFYAKDQEVIIIDDGICSFEAGKKAFPYTLITDKQNSYMNRYEKLYRFLKEDMDNIDTVLKDSEQRTGTPQKYVVDRSDSADASPLEIDFEDNFAEVYGMDGLKYLSREYGIIDNQGNNYFLDYFLHTKHGNKAVEENGREYHHPQAIGLDKYRKQLKKQNTCTAWGIKLFRFSKEDCAFKNRMQDDIKLFFGENTNDFEANGILADRSVKLYEHQENTLEEIQKQRAAGINTFLVVFPTASGKSKIVEEDLRIFSRQNPEFHALIMAPNTNIIDDWKHRVEKSLPDLQEQIEICSFAYMMRHYQECAQEKYNYIVVDEAHHAVSPVLKRVIQYFTPDFLIGLTATDQRPDKKKLETVFGNYKTGLSLVDAMQKKIVAEANVYRIETNLNLSHIRFNGKDYVNADLEKSIRVKSRNELIADVLQHYFSEGKAGKLQGVVFCANTNHAQEMERVLNAKGLLAKAYTRKAKNTDEIMQQFREKKIRFLCACEMISEGWDYPELGILVMARPTLSKVLYMQQIGRGLRRTNTKTNVFVIDVVDEYGAMAKPCSMHSIFANPFYIAFGSILKRDYSLGDIIEVDGLHETVERIVQVDIETFEEKYGDYLNQEQLAREFYLSTGTITSWVTKGKISPDEMIAFGSRKIYLFAPEHVKQIREKNNIPEHTEETIKTDFFYFLEERDYSLSYKIPFLLSFLKNMNEIGDAKIDNVLTDYIAFYQDRIDKGLPVDRSSCPYNAERLKDRKYIKSNMLTNPFEKFERKRFLYYSKDLNVISMNHALFIKMSKQDFERVKVQMEEDLEQYYSKIKIL